MPGRRAVVLLLVSAALAWGAHASVLFRSSMFADDFTFGRPWTASELRATWHDSWNPGSGVDRHYRPLTSLYHAVAFEAFGWNMTARHAISLTLLTLSAWLLALFVAREAGPAAGVLAAAVYVGDPLLPISASAWAFNQWHQVITLIVLAMVIFWQQRARGAGWSAWLPIMVLVAIGVLFKEDTIVVLPVLLACHQLRAWVVGDVSQVPRGVWCAAGLTVVALVLLRLAAYPESEWLHVPLFDAGGRSKLALECLKHGFGWMGSADDLNVPPAVSVLTVASVAAGLLLAVARRRTVEDWLTLSALTLVLGASAPLLAVANTHHTRSHLIALGSSLLIATSWNNIFRWLAHRRSMAALPFAAVGLTVLVFFYRGSLAIERQLLPCQPATIETGARMPNEDPWLDPAVKHWLATQAAQCAAGARQSERAALPVVVWHPPVNWPMAPHSTVAMLSQREGSAAVTLRAATATPDAPVRVRLSTDESVQTLELTSNDWRTVQVPLVSSWRFWLRQSHLLTVADQPLSGLVEVGTITLLPAGR